MHSHRLLRRILIVVGAICLAADLLMVFEFGSSMSLLHAVCLCGVTAIGAYTFPMRQFMIKAGLGRVASGVVLAGGVFFMGIGFFSDLGYTISLRTHSTTDATVQNTAYTTRQNQLASNKELLVTWKKQLEALTTQNAWAATTKADGLRAQIAPLQKEVDLEAARGGCKEKCSKRMQMVADMQAKIATIEQRDDLTKRIDATQKLVDENSEVAVNTKIGFSPVKAQTEFGAQLYHAFTGGSADEILHPGDVDMSLTNIYMGFLIALAATFAAPFANYLGFWGLAHYEEPEPEYPARHPQPAANPHTTTQTPPPPGADRMTFDVLRPRVSPIAPSMAYAATRDVLAAGGQIGMLRQRVA